MGLVHAENPCVADGRAKDIPRQIGQHGVVTVAVVLPEETRFPPQTVSGMAAKTAEQAAFKAAQELRGDLAGKGIDRHEELSPSRLPVLAIRSDPTAGNQQVDMGVIAQLAVPGVDQTVRLPAVPPRCRLLNTHDP